MADTHADPEHLEALDGHISEWLAGQLAANPVLAAVDREDGSDVRRWFVRLRGEQKDTFTIWFTLRDRTLHYETYMMPAPEENHEQLYEHLLRRNRKLFGAAFAIGEEDAVFLVGQVPLSLIDRGDSIDEGELDRILGSLFAYVEQCFRPALAIGFASRMAAGPAGR